MTTNPWDRLRLEAWVFCPPEPFSKVPPKGGYTLGGLKTTRNFRALSGKRRVSALPACADSSFIDESLYSLIPVGVKLRTLNIAVAIEVRSSQIDPHRCTEIIGDKPKALS